MLPARFRDQPGRWWLLASVLLAVVSLPVGHALAFDPSAWVVWGREVWHLGLDTRSGPSWKPFPVLFTAPLAVLGDDAGAAWLVVARSGALLGIVGAALLARRVAGGWAAAVAVATIVCSPWWLLNGALGNADPILGALVVWALLAAGEDRHRTAFALGVLGALIRPETWPFLAAYGLWLVHRRRIGLGPVLAAGVGILLLWIVPDLLASGLTSTTGATGTASPDSASLTRVPFLTVWKDLWVQGPWPAVLAMLLAAAILLRRDRRRATVGLWLGLVLAYTLLVALMAQAGFAGNPRYLVPALTLLAAGAGAIVGIGAGRRSGATASGGPSDAASPVRPPHALPLGWPARWRAATPPLLAAILVAALLAVGVGDVRAQARSLDDRAQVRRHLIGLVADRGGPDALKRAGPVRSASPGLRSLVAEVLHESVPAATHRARPGETVARPTPNGGWTIGPQPPSSTSPTSAP